LCLKKKKKFKEKSKQVKRKMESDMEELVNDAVLFCRLNGLIGLSFLLLSFFSHSSLITFISNVYSEWP
jgi:hypothetical protein